MNLTEIFSQEKSSTGEGGRNQEMENERVEKKG